MNKNEAVEILRNFYGDPAETDQNLIEDAREVVRLSEPEDLDEDLRDSGWSEREIEAVKFLAPDRAEIIRKAQAKIDESRRRRQLNP